MYQIIISSIRNHIWEALCCLHFGEATENTKQKQIFPGFKGDKEWIYNR